MCVGLLKCFYCLLRRCSIAEEVNHLFEGLDVCQDYEFPSWVLMEEKDVRTSKKQFAETA